MEYDFSGSCFLYLGVWSFLGRRGLQYLYLPPSPGESFIALMIFFLKIAFTEYIISQAPFPLKQEHINHSSKVLLNHILQLHILIVH